MFVTTEELVEKLTIFAAGKPVLLSKLWKPTMGINLRNQIIGFNFYDLRAEKKSEIQTAKYLSVRKRRVVVKTKKVGVDTT